ncbi:hypothetical protein [Solobacterium moorei]|uniref:hypothetical protein n=1 Tax=Solobacterium moorei TaxID=102148 RepID=UPI00042298E0|nr:hypothetical protein [Solobacterium moorei]MDI6415155.1 hypothetical protein [Solobacterium moorei]BET20643.1 hypothetical protein RGT18_02310 [Solobacterium moorei]
MNRSLKQKDRGNDMDKYRVGINMLVASAIVRAVILCTPLGWLAIVRLLLNLACLAVAIGGLWYLYQATGGQKVTNGLIYTAIAMVAYRIVLGIIHGFFGSIITLVVVICVLSYLRVYKYEDILKFVKQ